MRAREGAGRLAITSGGTIPDRGLFGVFLPDGTRVGELDEEMVYESRRGEVFLLGATRAGGSRTSPATAWSSRPRRASPARCRSGRATSPGRPLELGPRDRRVHARAARRAARRARSPRLREDVGLDELAAENLVKYLDDQREATGAVPDDRTIVVERFRDEIGDWRVCILSPFGSRVHAPWGWRSRRGWPSGSAPARRCCGATTAS